VEKFRKLLEKKHAEGKSLSGVEKDAKSSVLEHLKQMASDSIGDKLKGLKKVTVASDSPHGLAEGLDKAKEMIGDPGVHDKGGEPGEHMEHDEGHMMPNEEESDEHEASESPEQEEAEEQAEGTEADEHPEDSIGQEHNEFDHMSEDELDQHLQKLMQHKAHLKGKR
jgi:hypothetical protein